MTSYTVIWRIDVDAQSPRDAAEFAADILDDFSGYDWEYEVTDDETGELTKIDLDISDEDCDSDEVVEYERTLKRCSD